MILFDPDQAEAAQGFPRLAPRLSSAPAGSNHRAVLPAKATLARYLREAQAAVRLRGEVTVLLTTDEGIRELNRRFRKKNKPTDVLSFPVEDATGELAGDLAISVETAARQAAEQGHRLSVELRVLMLHGMLHLAGFDHETDDGEMARKEGRLRAKLGLPLGLIERSIPQGLKPRSSGGGNVRADARTLPSKTRTLRANTHTLPIKARIQAKADATSAKAPNLRRVTGAAR